MSDDQARTHPLPGVTDFEAPIDDRWLEDYRVGDVHEYGWASLSQKEIVDYARHYDPQWFHIDVGAAAAGAFGGIIASGWQTCGVMMRMYVDHYLSHCASMTSPGVDELRWAAPVRPDERLALRTTIVGNRVSSSKPDRGIVHTRTELFTEDRTVVLSMLAMNLLLGRPR